MSNTDKNTGCVTAILVLTLVCLAWGLPLFWVFVIGVILYHWFKNDRGSAPEYDKGENADSEGDWREERFLSCVFAMAAELAKADGRVVESEVLAAKQLFVRFNIPENQQKKYKDVFDSVIANPQSIYPYAKYVASNAASRSVRIFIYELLWDIACADGVLKPEEKTVLLNLCSTLQIPIAFFEINYRRRMGSFGEGGRQQGSGGAGYSGDGSWQGGYRRSARPHDDCSWAYDVIGCSPSATDNEVKAAYRKAAKAYHPDTLRANGVPEEMIAIATEKMAKLNEAWGCIRKVRKIK